MTTDEQTSETVPVVTPEPIEGGGLSPISMGMLQATTPEEMMAVAASIATPLKDFIMKRGLYKDLGGDTPHVYVEAWLFLAAMMGLAPQEIGVEENPLDLEHYPECSGWGPKYVAKMALVNMETQKVCSSASSECGGPDERSWHWRTKYSWRDGPNGKREKFKDGEAPVPGSQRRSMAITRATGKSCRLALGWVMTMAGWSPTPYEEFDKVDRDKYMDPAAPSDEPPHSADQGKDPRGDMGKRGVYEPGGHNRDRQEKQQPVQEFRFLRSKFGFVCSICGKDGKAGEPIAYQPSQSEGPYVAHADCHNSKHGG